MSEFSLIERFFVDAGAKRADVALGIGDDAAVISPPTGTELVTATDTMVAGVHFFDDVPVDSLGHKALAVNLSDLAAMGATPAWALLALTLPGGQETWLSEFVRGFGELARRYQVALVGGDTTRGPLTITVQVIGYLPAGKALTRHGAQPGDLIFVTGTLGDAAAALSLLKQNQAKPVAEVEYLINRLQQPEPRVKEGLLLSGMATSCIDISDGLIADLGHVLQASGVGARLQRARIPRSAEFVTAISQALIPEDVWDQVLTGGDDYELCFTLPAAQRNQLEALPCRVTEIGVITAESGIELIDENGHSLPPPEGGYDHFR